MWLHLFSQAKIHTELDLQDAILSDDSILISFIAILWAQFITLPLIKLLSYLHHLNFLTFLYLSFDRCYTLRFFCKKKPQKTPTCKRQPLNLRMYTRWGFMSIFPAKYCHRKNKLFTSKHYSQEKKSASTLVSCCGENSPKVFELLVF